MPRLADPSPEQLDLLAAVTAASAQRAAADRQYVASVVAASAGGLAVTRIARATGTTYQAVQALLRNARSGPGPGRGTRTDLIRERAAAEARAVGADPADQQEIRAIRRDRAALRGL